ncbi:MAG: ABC transporter permease subunit [Clostridiaceae bacterium]
MRQAVAALNKPVSTKTSSKEFFKKVYKGRYIYLLILPSVLFFIIFHYVPIYGIQLAFREFSYSGSFVGGKFIGLQNFRDLITEIEFWRAFKNTMIISFLNVILTFPLPIILAVLMNELLHKKFKTVVQTVVTLPHFISWVVVGGMAFNLLAHQGAINNLLEILGFDRFNFLMNPGIFRYLLVFSGAWKEVGWASIIYLAVIATIPPELYEAATVDGANRFHKIRYITWNGMKSMVILQLILAIGYMAQGNFMQVLLFYNPAVYSTGDIIDTYVYRLSFQRGVDFSFTTAVGLFRGVAGMILLLCANFLARRFGQKGVLGGEPSE